MEIQGFTRPVAICIVWLYPKLLLTNKIHFSFKPRLKLNIKCKNTILEAAERINNFRNYESLYSQFNSMPYPQENLSHSNALHPS